MALIVLAICFFSLDLGFNRKSIPIIGSVIFYTHSSRLDFHMLKTHIVITTLLPICVNLSKTTTTNSHKLLKYYFNLLSHSYDISNVSEVSLGHAHTCNSI